MSPHFLHLFGTQLWHFWNLPWIFWIALVLPGFILDSRDFHWIFRISRIFSRFRRSENQSVFLKNVNSNFKWNSINPLKILKSLEMPTKFKKSMTYEICYFFLLTNPILPWCCRYLCSLTIEDETTLLLLMWFIKVKSFIRHNDLFFSWTVCIIFVLLIIIWK